MQKPSDNPQLFPTSGNPLPDNARAGYFAGEDGTRLRYGLFAATGRPARGTFVVLPGRNEPIEKYFETVEDLQATGFGAAVMDLRGQGGSDRPLRDRQRGHVDSFTDYVSDLDRFLDEVVLADCRPPYYLLGHSTGGLVALMAAPLIASRIERMVLSAPLIEFDGRRFSMRNMERLAGLLHVIGLGSSYFGSGRRVHGGPPFQGNALTSDEARYARNQRIYDEAPQISMSGPTATWMRAACLAARAVADPDFMATITVPVLMVAAGADTVVSTPAIERYAIRLRSGSSITVDGARHELLQERDVYREQFLAALLAFAGSR
ncbi:MAG: alpha/beta hydrolase [Rhizobiaceae bacterium]|nr:alpha/beta hydrolase [Rhizobiaceae bacterium]MCV0406901.1 alpha/beta hydrolase [Rhizobiaceae bacterium]